MRKLFVCAALISFVGIAFGGTQAGKSSLAGQVYGSSGTEIAYGKMASSTTMYLLSFNLNYNSETSEAEFSGKTAEGPKTSGYSINLIPEYRSYLRPDAQVSPYWGIYALLGMGSSKTEQPDGGTAIASGETTGSNSIFGAGVTVGAEYFLNKTISLSANTRLAQISLSTEKSESGTGDAASTSTQKTMAFSLGISAGIYLRIYF